MPCCICWRWRAPLACDLVIDDFQKVSDRIPFLADLKPSGKYVMEDLHKVGGIPAVMKYLLEKDLLDGSCMTVTGKTIAENLKDVPGLDARPGRVLSDRKADQAQRPYPHHVRQSCARAVRWPRSPARKVCTFPGRRVFMIARRPCSQD